jgi:uncharacterized membrane-anchored protein
MKDNLRQRWDPASSGGRAPGPKFHAVLDRFVGEPVAAKVPEIIALFWVVKILTTAGGEATSDYFKTLGNIGGGGAEVALFLIGLALQFGTRRYRAFSYWFLAYAIAIFGTGVADFLHLDVGIPYGGTTILWAVVLIVVFWLWHHSEGTLSIHSITTRRREVFYWATVFATFALGTALGDFTAASLALGYLASGILFGIIILIPALARWRMGLNSVAAFWFAYVVTRPLGASFADYISKPRKLSGIGFGDGLTAVVFTAAVLVFVLYLTVVRPDIQDPTAAVPDHEPLKSAGFLASDAGESEHDTNPAVHNRFIVGWSERSGRLASKPARPIRRRLEYEKTDGHGGDSDDQQLG